MLHLQLTIAAFTICLLKCGFFYKINFEAFQNQKCFPHESFSLYETELSLMVGDLNDNTFTTSTGD